MTMMDAFDAFRSAYLATEVAQVERLRLQVEHETAVNAHRRATEEQARAYTAMVQAIKAARP